RRHPARRPHRRSVRLPCTALGSTARHFSPGTDALSNRRHRTQKRGRVTAAPFSIERLPAGHGPQTGAGLAEEPNTRTVVLCELSAAVNTHSPDPYAGGVPPPTNPLAWMAKTAIPFEF